VETLEDVPSALQERRRACWQQVLEPVVIAWEGKLPSIEVRLPYRDADTVIDCHLKLETGEERRWQWRGADARLVAADDVTGTRYVVKQLPLPDGLPPGYHRLTLELRDSQEESLVISAPVKAYSPPAGPGNRQWGVFIPLYALHTRKSWGAGDFSSLIELMEWVGEMRGQVIATLPLLPTFLDCIFEPSPYLPVSRLLWNELFLDITRVPELQDCPQVQELLVSAPLRDEIGVLRNSALVDYRQQMALKRKVLVKLSGYCFSQESRWQGDLRQFAEANPIVEDYARFRAACEKQGISWRSWPQPLREGVLREGDYDEDNRRYHLYVQLLAHRQMADVSERARGKGLHLYLDLPVGVHPDGYDVWRERDVFILDASVGAPPDAVFTKGQDWGFPPLHPQKIREQGYRYVIACLRHHLQHAGILRIDHVMGLHRLFCIPRGIEARHGVYLRYHAEELYAILALESHRHKAVVVGEDLGTVPFYVRPAMKKHGLNSMYVVQYKLASDPRKGLPPPPASSVASLNTHDTSPFTAFWRGMDIEDRLRLGLLDKSEARIKKKNLRDVKNALLRFLKSKGWLSQSEEGTLDVLRACLSFLAAGPARVLLINLEDLWQETRPQNVPSTRTEYPNWQRRARYSLEQFCQMPQVADTLKNINRLRKQCKDG
jgi:4-alpha-glucanotransferase